MSVPAFRAIALAVVALAITFYTLYRLLELLRLWSKVHASQSWPAVEAVVTKSRVTRSTVFVKNLNNTSYEPSLSYEYRLNGKAYKGRQITFGWGPGYRGEGQAQAHAARYAEGRPTSAYVNPADPREAVLERRLTAGQWGEVVLGILLTPVFWSLVLWFALN